MVTGCVIRKCPSVWSPISYTSYHCFPLKNPDILSKWMKAIPPGYITIPKNSSRICSRHFLDDCFTYTQSGKRTLKKDAIPTLFGSDAKKEDTLSSENVKTQMDTSESDVSFDCEEQKTYRYVKKSKYLLNKKPRTKPEALPVSNRSSVCPKESPKCILRIGKPKISDQEIELKKQIIMLKRRLLRRETQIKSMMKVMNSFQNLVKNEIPSD